MDAAGVDAGAESWPTSSTAALLLLVLMPDWRAGELADVVRAGAPCCFACGRNGRRHHMVSIHNMMMTATILRRIILHYILHASQSTMHHPPCIKGGPTRTHTHTHKSILYQQTLPLYSITMNQHHHWHQQPTGVGKLQCCRPEPIMNRHICHITIHITSHPTHKPCTSHV